MRQFSIAMGLLLAGMMVYGCDDSSYTPSSTSNSTSAASNGNTASSNGSNNTTGNLADADIEDTSEREDTSIPEDMPDAQPEDTSAPEDTSVPEDTSDVEPEDTPVSDILPDLPEGCLEPGFPDPEEPYEYSARIIRLNTIEPAGIVCGKAFTWTLSDQDTQPLAPPWSECVIDTPCGPLHEEHPDYASRVAEVCAGNVLPDLEEVTITLSNMALAPVHDRSLVLCPQTSSDPNAICDAAGLAACRPIDGRDAFDLGPGQDDLSVCGTLCEDGCGSGGDDSCREDGLCAVGPEGPLCAVGDACPWDGFTCAEYQPQMAVCQTPNSTQTERLTFVGPDRDTPIAVALVMDQSGSLSGRGLTEADRGVYIDRATDRNGFRSAAARGLLNNLHHRPYAEKTRVGIWSFRGTTREEVSRRTGTDGDPFISDFSPEGPTRAVWNALNTDHSYGRSNVYHALNEATSALAATPAGTRRLLFLFTDGPDDSVIAPEPDDREDALRQIEALRAEVNSASTDANVEIHIIHLDSGIGLAGLSVLAPDEVNPAPRSRDPQGRIGPLPEYEEFACATRGSYHYLRRPQMLVRAFAGLEALIPGRWEAEIVLEQNLTPGRAHDLSAEVLVEAGDAEERATFGFSYDGERFAPTNDTPGLLLFPQR